MQPSAIRRGVLVGIRSRGSGNVPRDAEFFGQDVGRARGKQRHRHLAAGEAVDDFVDGAVASAGDDEIEFAARRPVSRRESPSRLPSSGANSTLIPASARIFPAASISASRRERRRPLMGLYIRMALRMGRYQAQLILESWYEGRACHKTCSSRSIIGIWSVLLYALHALEIEFGVNVHQGLVSSYFQYLGNTLTRPVRSRCSGRAGPERDHVEAPLDARTGRGDDRDRVPDRHAGRRAQRLAAGRPARRDPPADPVHRLDASPSSSSACC